MRHWGDDERHRSDDELPVVLIALAALIRRIAARLAAVFRRDAGRGGGAT